MTETENPLIREYMSNESDGRGNVVNFTINVAAPLSPTMEDNVPEVIKRAYRANPTPMLPDVDDSDVIPTNGPIEPTPPVVMVVKPESKGISESKTVWINVISIMAFIAQQRFGFVMDAELQAEILMGINVLLRVITKHPVSWK